MKIDFAGWLGAAALVAVAGCGGDSPKPGPRDLGVLPDLATSPPDLAPAADLAVADLAMSGDVTTAHGDFYQYVVDSLTTPASRTDYAIDLNGDGKADNQLGSIVAALLALGFDPAAGVSASVQDGSTVNLITLQTADVTLMNDDTTGVVYVPGLNHPNPDFTGQGTFTVDNNAKPADLFGRLVAGSFSSNNPATTTHPVTMTMKLALFNPGPPVIFPLNGAHVQFLTGTDANSGAPGLLVGRIHGSIKSSDVQTIIVPAIAAYLTMTIAADPNSANAMQIENLFDSGGCTNADGTKAMANDQRIDPCEVASNQIVMNLLAPDVQIFDGKGNYAPNPANTMKDSLSVGVAFTAVKASF